MKRTLLAILIVCLAAGLVAAQKFRYDYDRSLDFQKFRTFAWMPDIKPPMPPNLEPEVVDGWIRDAVEKELTAKGMTKSDPEEADLMVSYLTFAQTSMSSQEADAQDVNRLPYGHWRPFGNTLPDSRLRTEGTLIVDLVDPKTRKLVWRGQVKDVLKKPDDPGKLRKKIDKLTPKLFKKFPPKK